MRGGASTSTVSCDRCVDAGEAAPRPYAGSQTRQAARSLIRFVHFAYVRRFNRSRSGPTTRRPGARSETTELYLKRLENLELIANSYRGVEKSYAIQAGREIRVIVEPGKIDDNEAMQMARNISKQIEQELDYPGQIKVTVVREMRCIEYAR